MKHRHLFSALALAAGVLTQPVVMAQSSTTKSVLVNQIEVVVNDDVITTQELEQKMTAIETRLRRQGTQLPSRTDLKKQVLERMIIDKVQTQLAKENGIRVDDFMLDKTMLRLAEQNRMSMSDFRNQVEREGTTYARFRDEVRDDIILQRIREREVDSKINVSEVELDNYLAAQEAAKAGKFEVQLSHILVAVPENATTEQINARKARAMEVLQKVREGVDFSKLAVTYSDSPEGIKGGDLGWREQERVPQLFADAISKLNPGQNTELLRSSNGFHIIKLVNKRASTEKAATGVQQTKVRHILMKISNITPAAEVKKKLLEIKQKIANKEATFEEMAKTYSTDATAAKGGDLGWIYPSDTVPEFEQAMDKLAVNEISEPVQSQFGLHLIQVLERKTDEMSKERKRAAARQAVSERKADEAYQDWLREIRDRAYIDYRNKEKS